ncbi:MAG: phenylacetic acid degradation protein [Gemmatimonadota bacterium]|jgi:acyl-CoA thioesterase
MAGASVSTPRSAEEQRAVDAQARAVVERMMTRDAFSRWLGVELVEIAERRSVIRMTVRPEMVNGFGTAHGGIVFAFADSALAFCTNSDGEISVALDCTVSYPTAVRPGDVLTATGVQESTTNKIGFARVTVVNQDAQVVGHFRGTVYRTRKPLPL